MKLIILYFVVFFVFYCLTINSEAYKKRKNPDDYFYVLSVNITFVLFVLLFVIKYKNLFITKISYTPDVLKIIGALMLFDTIFYWTHRMIHRIPFLKKNIHETHHKIGLPVPLDFMYEDIYSILIHLNLYVFFPLLTLEFMDIIIYLVIVISHHIYAHSNVNFEYPIPLFINSRYHLLHHTIGKGNYSFLFPFWDNYMNTRIKEPAKAKAAKAKAAKAKAAKAKAKAAKAKAKAKAAKAKAAKAKAAKAKAKAAKAKATKSKKNFKLFFLKQNF